MPPKPRPARPPILGTGEQPRIPKKPTKEAILERGPWLPAPYELADVSAIQALGAGTADKHQQVRALRWIIELAAGTYDMSYRPGGDDGRRDTDFAEGKRYVGNQVVKLLKADIGKMRRNEPLGDPHEPKS